MRPACRASFSGAAAADRHDDAVLLRRPGASWLLVTHLFDFSALDIQVELLGFLFLVALGVDYRRLQMPYDDAGRALEWSNSTLIEGEVR